MKLTELFEPLDSDIRYFIALSKEISNGDDTLTDYNIVEKIPNYSKTRIAWVRENIRREITKENQANMETVCP